MNQKVERSFKGIWIPADIWLSEELSLQEKVFLVEIDSLDNEDGCFASNSYFADFFQISKSRASQVISSLADKGYISVQIIKEGRQVKERILRINRPPYPCEIGVEESKQGSKKIKEGSKFPKDPYLENCEDNNIINNNIDNNIDIRETTKTRNFKIPDIEEIRAYCQERNNGIDAERFFDYYQSRGWMIGKNKMKDWKAAVRTWERNNKTKQKPESKTTYDINELEDFNVFNQWNGGSDL